jgi:hypothetical protein
MPVRAIMADNDVKGHVNVLVRSLRSDEWRELWLSLNLMLFTFADLSLSSDASDAELWHACQEEQVVLITGNRNDDGPDSLQATIKSCNTPTSLPVFTLSEPRRVLRSGEYASRVAVKLLQHLFDIEKLRGAGRLWLP